jgi:PAP_fibrillin
VPWQVIINVIGNNSSSSIRMKYLVFLLVLSAVDLSYGWIPPISPSMQNCLPSIFRPQHIRCRRLAIFQDALHGGDISDLEADADNSSPIEPELARLKSEFLTMAAQTKRGFQATAQERNRIRDIIYELARFNPSREPARGYYERSATDDDNDNTIGSTITGKWTLIYTDAPDITGLDTSRNPFATAKLGRIGQECSPP